MNRAASVLGGFERKTDSPRRKKKKKNVVVFAVTILLLVIIYIAYAMSQPEEIIIAGVAPSIDGASAVMPAMSSATPNGMAAFAADEMEEEAEQESTVRQRALPSQNPVAAQLNWLDSYWKAAVRQVNAQTGSAEIQTQMAVLDIAHADLFSLFEELDSLLVGGNGWQDATGAAAGRIEPDASLENGYIFSISEQNLTLMGRLDSSRNAFYYIVQDDEDKTKRFAEVVTNNDYCYVQLLTASGPYQGVLLFQFDPAGSVRAARIRSENFAGLTQIFDNAPNDWNSFTEMAEQLFAVEAGGLYGDETDTGDGYASG